MLEFLIAITISGEPRGGSLAQDAVPDVVMDELFRRSAGWIGADGAHSVALSPTRTLWLFSDTWVGTVQNGRRTNATIVNNSIGLQDGRGQGVKFEFVIRRTANGKPLAMIAPKDGRGWFWLQSGAFLQDRLFLFLTQVEKSGGGVFGFRVVGQWLGIVDNPSETPLLWRIRQEKLPCVMFEATRERTFGAAVFQDGDFLYVFGTDEDITALGRDRHLIVARVAKPCVADFREWRYFGNGGWHADFRAASRLANEMGSEASVTHSAKLRRYVLVYSRNGLSNEIRMRTAPAPWGPWSEAVTIYRCPEATWDKRIFCYAAKAHASQSTDDELLISYVANSFDFWHVAADDRLYWPRFVRVRIGDHK